MSTTPSIERVVLLPTLKPVIEVKSATAGSFNARQIIITVDGVLQPAVVETWASGTNRYTLGPFDRGAVLGIYVQDHETVSDTWKGSGTEAFDNLPVTSYEGTIRQAITDILVEAGIEIDGREATVHADDFGRPILVRMKKEQLGPFPLIEVGAAIPSSRQIESRDCTITSTDVSITVADAADDQNDAVNNLPILVNRVFAALEASVDLDMNAFGVSQLSWDYRLGGQMISDRNETDSVVLYEFGVVVHQERETGAFVPE